MADYLQTLRMKNMFPGTETPPQNFGGTQGYDFTGPTQDPYSDPYSGGNMFQPLQNEYGVDEGYGNDFTGPMQGPDTSDYDPNQRMNQLYDPQHEQSDQFNQLLDTYPQRPPEKTGWGKIGAIAGEMVLGRGFYDEFMHGKHNRAVEDWKSKAGPTQQAAQIERYNNENQRRTATSTINTEMRQNAAEAKAKNDEMKNRIAQQKADAADFLAKNPHMEIVPQKGGNVMVRNPRTNEITTLVDKLGQPIPSGTLTQADEIGRRQTNELARIAARDTNSDDAAKQAQTDRLALEEAREKNRPPSSGPGSNKGDTAGQIRTRQISKAEELRNTNPALRKWINITGNNIDITPPSVPGRMYGSTEGPTAEEHAAIQKAIYGNPDTDRRAITADKRQKAIKILTDAGKPLTPANIDHVAGKIP